MKYCTILMDNKLKTYKIWAVPKCINNEKYIVVTRENN
jgi:hypothetical protein